MKTDNEKFIEMLKRQNETFFSPILKEREAQMLSLIQSLKDYTREGNVILGHDERKPEELLKIWKENRK